MLAWCCHNYFTSKLTIKLETKTLSVSPVFATFLTIDKGPFWIDTPILIPYASPGSESGGTTEEQLKEFSDSKIFLTSQEIMSPIAEKK